MSLAFLPLDIECCFVTTAILPVFKGSTLRGAFGHALKKVACTLRNQQCESCLLNTSCAYALMFATEKLQESRVSARPHPYILLPPTEEKREYQPGDTLRFGLTLLGPATGFLPHIIYCLQEMGNSGLGKGTKRQEGRYVLSSVSVAGKIIYSGDGKRLSAVKPEQLALAPGGDSASHIIFSLQSPLRLKFENFFLRRITFLHLVRAALRRIHILESSYGDPNVSYDFKRLCAMAEQISTAADSTRWIEYQRYSNRQKNNMLFGGVMGELSFAGELDEYLPFFRYAERVGLGKQTAFGFGQIEVQVKP